MEFMAPEVFDGDCSPACDVYSFGMLVLEMITKQTPYRECTNIAQIYKKIFSGQKPIIMNMIIDEDIKGFINECLKPVKDRPTVRDLLKHP